MKFNYLLNSTAALFSFCAIISAPAYAEELVDVSDRSIAENDTGISDIVVTAQRRSENLMEVPLSIQASTGEQLKQSGIKDLTSMQFATPGYLAATNGGFTQIFIRGIGNSNQTGGDPSVTTFVDDVPRIYGSMSDNFFDVERVEVLKGAQGGLYGRNTTGGVVNVITSRPDTERLSGKASVSYGERDTFRSSAYLNVPFGENVAWTIAAQRDTHDPYVRNKAKKTPYTAEMFPSGWVSENLSPQQTADYFNAGIDPQPLNNQDYWAVRSKLLIEPSHNFSIVFSGDYYDKNDTSGQGVQNLSPAVTRAGLVGLFTALGVPTNLPNDIIQSTGKFEAAQGNPISVDTREYGFSATAVWSLPGADITSISAYRNQRTYFAASSANADVNDVIVDVSYPYKRFFYQELRVATTFDGPLSVLAGASYLNNQLKGQTQSFRISRDFRIANTEVEQNIQNWSVYAQLGYELTDALTVTASGRYMREGNVAEFTAPVVSRARSVQEAFIPSLTLSYGLDGGNIYGRWARGFKTGGVNLATAPFYFPRPQDGSIFEPETVDTYEIGYKQSLFGRRLQVATSVFYNDYRDLQINARGNASYPQITTAYVNAESARTYGAEASLNWRVVPALTLGANVGYLNAKFKNFELKDSTVLAPFDRSGTVMPKAPEWQFSLSANVDTPINNAWRFVANALVSHTTEVLFIQSARPGVLPDAVVPALWMTNGRVGIKSADDRYGFAVVADNIFNVSNFSSSNSLSMGHTRVWGNPRIIRGEVTVGF